MAIEFTTTSRTTAAQGVKIAIYGNAGTGKTSVLATAPAPFLIAVEPGLICLKPANIVRMFGTGTPGIAYDIPVAKIKQVPGQSPLVQIRELHKAFLNREPWTHSISTIGMDSISQLAEWELSYQRTQTTNLQAAYGAMADEILEVIRDFTTLEEKHFVATAKQSISDHFGLFSANFPGQLLNFHFPYEFDATLQMCVGQNEQGMPTRFFRTQPDVKNFAKDRTGALSPTGEQAYLYNIFNKISAA